MITCHYQDCYDNDNLQHRCLRDAITLGLTGNCENLQHCDEYECGACERFAVCAKEKRQAYLDAGGVAPAG